MSVLRQGNSGSKLLFVLSLVVLALSSAWATRAEAAFSDYGLDNISVAESTSQAGAHPDVLIDFNLKTDPASEPDTNGNREPYARLRSVKVELPPGLVGNPNAVSKCTVEQFASFTTGGEGCPQDTQVGVTRIRQYKFFIALTEPIYNLETPNDDTVARLGFYSATLPYFINVGVRSGSDYGLTSTIENPPSAEVVGVTTELWGVPADPSHDNLRLTPREAFPEGKDESPPRKSGLDPAPFLTNPTTCNQAVRLRISTDSYQEPGVYSSLDTAFPTVTGCDKLDFEPEFSALPTSREAGAPTGLDTALTIPQNESPDGLATSQLRAATVTLPAGMTISPTAADGLAACSADQLQVGTELPSGCPDAARIGSAEFDVPALSRRMHGGIYQRTPEPGHLFRIWLVSDELGVHIKIPGEIHADQATGQLTATFEDTPQVPVRELDLHFKSGARGVLMNPASCGTYSTLFEFSPWSGNPPVHGATPMTIDEGCAQGFAPRLNAGTVSPSAGAFSPFVLSLGLDSKGQNILGFDVELPKGLLAKLAGVPVCPAAAAAAGACDPASQVGTVDVGIGPGPAPLWIPQAGKSPTAVYLAGPYKGEPYSLVVKVPAQAGPFDLGTVVTRAGLHVNPRTAQVTVKTDPLPQILEGVPITYRDIRVHTDRSRFTLNPTSCDPMSVEATVIGTAGTVADPSSRFQAAGCERLKFKPSLSLRLKGGVKRGAYPALTAVMKARRGHANLQRVQVALPHSEFLAQEHIRTICTRVQFAADNCPRGSVYGFAQAVTPLLDKPLKGPVYLRSSNHRLPDLIVALRGQIDVELAGRIDSVDGGMRVTFGSIPDAPVSRFVLKMKGGKKGLLVNSRNLCSAAARATVKIDGQNGKTADRTPQLAARCRS